MNRTYLQCMIGMIGLAAAEFGQQGEAAMSDRYPFIAAFISTLTEVQGRTDLVVFPFQGKAVRIPIHSVGGPFMFSPDGTALFGQCTPASTGADKRSRIALCRIDIKTNTVTPVPGSAGLYVAHLAISTQGDHILVSGVKRQNGDVRGVFDLDINRSSVTPILSQADVRPQSAWSYLSLSPDGERAVALHNGRVELIDLVRGTAQPLQEDLFMAAWSPDGKWLAALERGEKGRTILMDAKSLTRRRVLGPSELDWSPDSRYLLGLSHKGCDSDHGTLEAIHIETGERTTIQSSTCLVNQATTGWVAADIWRK